MHTTSSKDSPTSTSPGGSFDITLADANGIPVAPVFHACETEAILNMTVEMINRLIQHNDRIPLTSASLTRFHSRAPPTISITDYLRRIVKYAAIEKSVLLLLLIYVDRICEIHRTFTISSLTAHRFIISAVVAGCKSLSDIYCTNTHFAKVGGISCQELNVLELEFCKLIGWRLSCSMDTLQQYYISLVRTSSRYIYPNVTTPVVLYPEENARESQLGTGQDVD
ncbi:hypothetical protein HK097_010095 [Rhizophlyctis rosea]|uniref:Cyclin-domain-containing protein n=1 Tax=Rhizophlyctis rosea TaxID=64517 RepID=A0AAD5X545_9FUNG|nr:hypothetical protein HK097_010095 [Rhizophlyctis rosea]